MSNEDIEMMEKELNLSGYSKFLVLEIVSFFIKNNQFWFEGPNKKILYYRTELGLSRFGKLFTGVSILSLIIIIYFFGYYFSNKTLFLFFLVIFLPDPFIPYLYLRYKKNKLPMSGFISLSESNARILTLNARTEPKKLGNDFKIEISDSEKFNELQKVHEERIDRFLKSGEGSALSEITLDHLRKLSVMLLDSLFYSPGDYKIRESYPDEEFNYKKDRGEIADTEGKKRPILITILGIYYIIRGFKAIFQHDFLGFPLDFIMGIGLYKQKKVVCIFILLIYSIAFIVFVIGIPLMYFGFILPEYKLGIAPFDYKSMVIGLMTVLIPMIIIISNWKVFK